MPIKQINNYSNDSDKHYDALVTRQTRNDKNYNTSRGYDSFSIGSTAVVQQKMMEQGPMEQWLEKVIITTAIDLTWLEFQR